MNISLTPELEQYVQEKVSSGFYTSVSEVIRQSLRLMYTYDDLQKNQINQLNQAIDLGMAQLQAGNKIPAKESYQRLKNKITAISKSKK